jgi:hypothetical protein
MSSLGPDNTALPNTIGNQTRNYRRDACPHELPDFETGEELHRFLINSGCGCGFYGPSRAGEIKYAHWSTDRTAILGGIMVAAVEKKRKARKKLMV